MRVLFPRRGEPMPRAQQIAAISQNRLLAVIPPEQLERLAPQFRRVPLVFKETLFEAGEWIEFFYFPLNGAIVMIASTESGTSIGVGIGKEGAADVSVVLGNGISSHRGIVQLAGSALKLSIAVGGAGRNRGAARRQRQRQKHPDEVRHGPSAAARREHRPPRSTVSNTIRSAAGPRRSSILGSHWGPKDGASSRS